MAESATRVWPYNDIVPGHLLEEAVLARSCARIASTGSPLRVLFRGVNMKSGNSANLIVALGFLALGVVGAADLAYVKFIKNEAGDVKEAVQVLIWILLAGVFYFQGRSMTSDR